MFYIKEDEPKCFCVFFLNLFFCFYVFMHEFLNFLYFYSCFEEKRKIKGLALILQGLGNFVW